MPNWLSRGDEIKVQFTHFQVDETEGFTVFNRRLEESSKVGGAQK